MKPDTHCTTTQQPSDRDQIRCCCGKLLAVQKGNYIVIRCSRCKHQIRIRIKVPVPQE